MNCAIHRDNTYSPGTNSGNGPVSSAISARQERIQQLFAGDDNKTDDSLPQVNVYDEKKPKATIKDYERKTFRKYTPRTRKPASSSSDRPLMASFAGHGKHTKTWKKPQPQDNEKPQQEPAEDLTEQMDSSFNSSWSSVPSYSGSLNNNNSTSSLSSRMEAIPDPPKQQELPKEEETPAKEPEEPTPKPEPKAPEPQPKHTRRARRSSLAHQIDQMRELTAHMEHKTKRNHMHQEILDKASYCQKVQQEADAKREADFGTGHLCTELPVSERQAKRQERLRLAKERVQRQEEEERRKNQVDPQVVRCDRAMAWYVRHGMPTKRKMLQQLQAMNEADRDGITEQDVDLMPWMPGEFMVDLTAMATVEH